MEKTLFAIVSQASKRTVRKRICLVETREVSYRNE